MKPFPFLPFFLLAALGLLPGCTILRPPQPTVMNYYALEAETGQATTPAGGGGRLTLEVSPTRALPGFDVSRMVYVKRPSELDYFAQNQWVAPPARMITPQLVLALAHSGKFHAVVQGAAAAAQLRLDSELVRLQQDFLQRPSRVRLTLRVQLIDVGTQRVLASGEFGASEAAPADNPYGGVLAANRALTRVLAQVAAFCSSRADAAYP